MTRADMPWRATILTLYPEMFPGPLGVSLSGDALARGEWSLEARNIREHGLGRHRNVDDTPSGGGAGMVLRCDVLAAAIDAAAPQEDPRPRLLMSPGAARCARSGCANSRPGRVCWSSAVGSRGWTSG